MVSVIVRSESQLVIIFQGGWFVMQYKLESLRGLAACLVVLFHAHFYYRSESLSFISNSYLFVDFFFILSGFLMSLAYSSRIHEGLGIREYGLLRLGRIYPLHLAMLLLWGLYILVCQPIQESWGGEEIGLEKNNPMSFLSHIFLLNAMGVHDYLSWNYPAWSISTEFFTYIVFFLLTKTLDKGHSLIIPLAISAGCYGFIISLDRNNLDITYDYGFFRCVGGFYLGVFVNRVSRFVLLPEKTINNLWIWEIFCIVSVVAFVSLADDHFLYFIPIVISFSIAIFVFSQNKSGFFGSLLLAPLLKNIGAWSYSIYMTHYIILIGVFNAFEHILKWDIKSSSVNQVLFINSVALFLIIVISRYSYLLIEKPLREKSRVIARKYKKPMQSITSLPAG